MLVAELDFSQTVAAGFLNAFFTALFVGIGAAIVTLRYQDRSAKNRQAAELEHQEQLQTRQLEHQTRAALRETYAQLLVAQRRSRQASIRLAKAGGASTNSDDAEAVSCHDQFIDLYHRLNLDASREMWNESRSLRGVLDNMLKKAREGNESECESLAVIARNARQNLERSFRIRLGSEPLQSRTDLGEYDR